MRPTSSPHSPSVSHSTGISAQHPSIARANRALELERPDPRIHGNTLAGNLWRTARSSTGGQKWENCCVSYDGRFYGRSSRISLTENALARLPDACAVLFQGNRDALARRFTEVASLLVQNSTHLEQLFSRENRGLLRVRRLAGFVHFVVAAVVAYDACSSGHTSTTPCATAQGVCDTLAMASAKSAASIMAKPASGNEDVMNGPFVVST